MKFYRLKLVCVCVVMSLEVRYMRVNDGTEKRVAAGSVPGKKRSREWKS